MMKKLQMSKEAFDMAKGAFRKVFKKHKSEAKRTKKTKGLVPTVPYDLKKADVKKRLRSINLTTAAEIKATPGARRKIITRIERSKREKKKFGKPVIYGKAFASDKAGKTMQIQPLTKQQRKLMLKEMAVSADRGYKKVRMRKYGYNSGGDVKAIKTVATKLSKASKAHAGQSKVLKRIIKKYV